MPSLAKRARNLLQREAHTDVEFVVGPENGETKSFRAHRLILAMSSEALEAMFFGVLAQQDKVRIIDLDATGFDYFVRYLYSESLEVETILEALQTRQAADKYLVPHLVGLCTEFIGKSIKALTPNEACRAKEHLALFKEHSFDDTIDSLIETQSKAVLECEAFVEASEDTVHHILRMNKLSVPEDDLMNALYALVRARCSQRACGSTGEEVRKILDPFLWGDSIPDHDREGVHTRARQLENIQGR